MRVLPFFIRSLVGSLPIQPRQLRARGRGDPRFLRQPLQKLLVCPEFSELWISKVIGWQITNPSLATRVAVSSHLKILLWWYPSRH